MKASAILVALLGVTYTNAVNMTPYQAGAGVETGFTEFIKEYYVTSEDQYSTDNFTDFWPSDGQMILAGTEYVGTQKILAVKTALLPPGGNKSWWHIIRSSTVVTEDDAFKTYEAEIVIQTTYEGGNCSQAYGTPRFTVTKDASGNPNLTPHTQALDVYNLTVSTTKSPTDIPCSAE